MTNTKRQGNCHRLNNCSVCSRYAFSTFFGEVDLEKALAHRKHFGGDSCSSRPRAIAPERWCLAFRHKHVEALAECTHPLLNPLPKCGQIGAFHINQVFVELGKHLEAMPLSGGFFTARISRRLKDDRAGDHKNSIMIKTLRSWQQPTSALPSLQDPMQPKIPKTPRPKSAEKDAGRRPEPPSKRTKLTQLELGQATSGLPDKGGWVHAKWAIGPALEPRGGAWQIDALTPAHVF